MLLFLAISCTTPSPSSDVGAASADPVRTVVVYSGRSESLVGPIFEKMQDKLDKEDAKIQIKVQYGNTPELVSRFLAEGDQSPADLIFAQDSGYLGVLSDQDQLQPLPDALLASVDPRFHDPNKRWVGTSGRLRTLVVDSKLPADELPTSLQDLTLPKWKGKLGWAPSNSSFQAHVSALRSVWGEEKTKQWLTDMLKNEPKAYPKNSPQVAAVNEGAISIGWVNHYYLHRVPKEGRRATNHAFPASGNAGNLLMVSGVGVRKGSPHKTEAERVIAELLTDETQTTFAQTNFEYPTKPGIKTHPDVTPLTSVTLLDVDQAALSNLGPTRQMLQSLGLQ